MRYDISKGPENGYKASALENQGMDSLSDQSIPLLNSPPMQPKGNSDAIMECTFEEAEQDCESVFTYQESESEGWFFQRQPVPDGDSLAESKNMNSPETSETTTPLSPLSPLKHTPPFDCEKEKDSRNRSQQQQKNKKNKSSALYV